MTVSNKEGLAVLREEIDSLKQEKDSIQQQIKFTKKELVYVKEENVITRMQNQETQRQIDKKDKIREETHHKRLHLKTSSNQELQDLFKMSESAKVFQQTLEQLQKAITTEKVCIITLNEQIKQIKVLIKEETHKKSLLPQSILLQKKQINSLNLRHDLKTTQLHFGLTHANDDIKNCLDDGAKDIKNMERHNKNLALNYIAKQTEKKMHSSRAAFLYQ